MLRTVANKLHFNIGKKEGNMKYNYEIKEQHSDVCTECGLPKHTHRESRDIPEAYECPEVQVKFIWKS
jgi:hypothetical protein